MELSFVELDSGDTRVTAPSRDGLIRTFVHFAAYGRKEPKLPNAAICMNGREPFVVAIG